MDELEIRIARDFSEKLRDLLAIYVERLSPEARHKHSVFESIAGDITLETFQAMRKPIHIMRNEIVRSDVEAIRLVLAELLAGKRTETTLLADAVALWGTAAKRDKRKTQELAMEMVKDVEEWQELGGAL